MTMSLKEVRNLATSLHRGQEYGKDSIRLPFVFHLHSVECNVLKFATAGEFCTEKIEIMRKAALLHDSIEDCGITQKDLLNYGVESEVVDIVWALTDGKEGNRKVRHGEAYKKIADLEYSTRTMAIFVKLCDRLANSIHSYVTRNSGMQKMYLKEHESFLDGLSMGCPYLQSLETFRGLLQHIEAMLNETIDKDELLV